MFSKVQLINNMKSLIEKDKITNTLLLALKHKYYYIYNHSLNVSISAYLLGNHMNFSEEESFNLSLSGLFHDIGKLNIPSNILYKSSPLTSQERIVFDRHPIVGINLLNGSEYLLKVHNAVLYHHEKYDGNGFGKKLNGQDIPLEARIISICDCFDEMISYRSYKKALTLEEAKQELIKDKNIKFDPQLVDSFLEIVDNFYNKYYANQDPLYVNEFIKNEENDDISIRWEEILNRIPNIGVILIDKSDKIKFCNKFAAEIRNKEQREIEGNYFTDFHKVSRSNTVKEKLLKVKCGEINGWQRIMKRNNRYIENKYISIHDKNNNYEGLLMLTQDISEKEEMLTLLEKNLEDLNILVQANNLLTEVYDLNEISCKAFELFIKIIQVDYMNIVIEKYKDRKFYIINNMDGFTQDIKEYINENVEKNFYTEKKGIQFKVIGDKILIMILMKSKNNNLGIIYIQADAGAIIEEREEKLLQLIGNYTNSAIQKYLFFREIHDKAIRDNLTGIYNRQYFQTIVESINPELNPLGVIVVDINNMKHINDTFGHLYGDLAIKTTAEILKKSIKKDDYAFRYGGDEFIIISFNCNEEVIRKILKRINNNIKNHWDTMGLNIKLTLSMGYAISIDENNISEIIRVADKNMYMDKKRYKIKAANNIKQDVNIQ